MTMPPNFRWTKDSCADCTESTIKRRISSVTRKQTVYRYCEKHNWIVDDETICDDYDKMKNINIRRHKEDKSE